MMSNLCRNRAGDRVKSLSNTDGNSILQTLNASAENSACRWCRSRQNMAGLSSSRTLRHPSRWLQPFDGAVWSCDGLLTNGVWYVFHERRHCASRQLSDEYLGHGRFGGVQLCQTIGLHLRRCVHVVLWFIESWIALQRNGKMAARTRKVSARHADCARWYKVGSPGRKWTVSLLDLTHPLPPPPSPQHPPAPSVQYKEGQYIPVLTKLGWRV